MLSYPSCHVMIKFSKALMDVAQKENHPNGGRTDTKPLADNIITNICNTLREVTSLICHINKGNVWNENNEMAAVKEGNIS